MFRQIRRLAFCIVVVATSAAAQDALPSSGNVGVATTSPGLYLPQPADSTGPNTYPWPATGNIGIGTASPDANLTIVGSMGLWSDSQYHGNIRISSVPDATTGNSYYSGAIVFSPQYYDGSTFSFPERMRITSSGNVGIGTTTPQAPLDVAGTQIQLYDPSQSAANYSYLKTSAYTNNTQKLTLGTTFGYNTPVDALTIWDGDVGIGTPNPTQKLEVNGYIQTDAGIYFPGNSTPQTQPYTGTTCGGDYAEAEALARSPFRWLVWAGRGRGTR